MRSVFLTVLNMSITASFLAVAVMILRLIFKRSPRWMMCVLWGFVAIRLIIPFSFESALSLLPSAEPIPNDIIYSPEPSVNTGITAVDKVINPVISDRFSPEKDEDLPSDPIVPEEGIEPSPSVPEEPSPSVPEEPTPLFSLTAVLSAVWLTGTAAMLIYTLVSYFCIRRRIGEAVECDRNILICDRISSPFILGVFRPRIYLPSSMNENDMKYVIAHERAHLSRLDHLWKPVGFLLLAVYWFNPIMWMAYILLCKDIELACDEKVIGKLGNDFKKPYSEALINCSIPRRMVSACPVAFGEVGVKERIRNIMKFKKPTIIICAAAVLVCAAVAVFFLTNPIGKEEEPQNQDPSPKILSPEEYPEDIDNLIYMVVSTHVGHLNSTGMDYEYDILAIEEKKTDDNKKEQIIYAVATYCHVEENNDIGLFKDSLSYVDDVKIEFDFRGRINAEKIYDYSKLERFASDYYTKTSAFEIKLEYDNEVCIKSRYWESNDFPDEVKKRFSEDINWDVESYFKKHEEKMQKNIISAIFEAYGISNMLFEDEFSIAQESLGKGFLCDLNYRRHTYSGGIWNGEITYYFTAEYKDGLIYFVIDEQRPNNGEEEIDYTLVFRPEGDALVFVKEGSDNILGDFNDGDKLFFSKRSWIN